MVKDTTCPCSIFVMVPDTHGKYIFTQGSFYLQSVPYDFNEQDTSFLDCKHKHMMKSGALPDKVSVLHCLFPIEVHGFTSRIAFVRVSTLCFLVLSQFFRECTVPLNLLQ